MEHRTWGLIAINAVNRQPCFVPFVPVYRLYPPYNFVVIERTNIRMMVIKLHFCYALIRGYGELIRGDDETPPQEDHC